MFRIKYESIFEYLEKNDVDQEIRNYIDELEASVN